MKIYAQEPDCQILIRQIIRFITENQLVIPRPDVNPPNSPFAEVEQQLRVLSVQSLVIKH